MNHLIALTALLLLFARSARAGELNAAPGALVLKLGPGLAVPLTNPQSRGFQLGGGQTIKALLNGRALARIAAVTLDANVIVKPSP